MIKLLITDLDDTLYSWIKFFVPAFYAMAEEVAKIVQEDKTTILAEYKEVHQKIGSVEVPFATLMLPSVKQAFSDMTEEQMKEQLDPAFHRFNSVRKQQMSLFPGVRDTLASLNNEGIRIVGYTESASENGVFRLKQLGIEPYFSRIYVSDSWKKDNKTPHPYSEKARVVHGKKPNINILKTIIDEEGLHRSNTVYVGDSLTKDIYMAKQVGVTSILYNNNNLEIKNAELYEKLVAITSWTKEDFANETRLKAECESKKIHPDYVISEFSQLIQIINQINEEETNGNK